MNLRNKRYCLFNTQLSKEDYQQKIEELAIYKRSNFKNIEEKFWEFVKSQPVLGSRSVRSVDSEGVLLVDCKNCTHCVSVERAENERYCESTISHRDSMDLYASGASELMYQSAGSGGDSANLKFSVISKMTTHSEYVINCRNCQFCFGCIALENKKYCIFNTQYEPDEYFKKIDEIKTALLHSGEYGEFFPYSFSAFAYNGSDVDYIYPLDKDEIEKLGGLYQEDIETDLSGISTISIDELPDSIKDVTDDILSKAIICEETGKPFRIIASELEFYRRHNLPLPTVQSYERTKNMFKYMGNHLTHDSVCESCGISIKSMYEPNTGWHTYCESCFNKEVV